MDWSKMTPEQREEYNAKRRAKYAEDEAYREKEKTRKNEVNATLTDDERLNRNRKARTKYKRVQDIPIGPNNWLHRLALRADNREKRIEDMKKRYAAWDGKWPTPNQRIRCNITLRYFEALATIGRKCSHCGCEAREMPPSAWRIVMRTDPLYCVSHTEQGYMEVIKHPERFRPLCCVCAIMTLICAYYWVFGALSPRNKDRLGDYVPPPNPGRLIIDTKWEWKYLFDAFPRIYPPTDEAIHRLCELGRIRSIRYKFRKHTGEWVNFHLWYKGHCRHLMLNPKRLMPMQLLKMVIKDNEKNAEEYREVNKWDPPGVPKDSERSRRFNQVLEDFAWYWSVDDKSGSRPILRRPPPERPRKYQRHVGIPNGLDDDHYAKCCIVSSPHGGVGAARAATLHSEPDVPGSRSEGASSPA